jgi:DNA-binding Xre family transcriptional regulator
MFGMEVIPLTVSYKKLWKLLIDRDMKKKDLLAAAGISQSSLSKMRRNENVNMDILVKVCTALNCDIGDIMEIVKNNEELSLISIRKLES